MLSSSDRDGGGLAFTGYLGGGLNITTANLG
jgi:hypothetical protein